MWHEQSEEKDKDEGKEQAAEVVRRECGEEEMRETRGMRWADCEDDGGEEKEEQETARERQQEVEGERETEAEEKERARERERDKTRGRARGDNR